MNNNFKIVNEFLGFGEPSGKIWFIGIEEGGKWPKNHAEFKNGIKEYRDSGGILYNENWGTLKSPIHIVISKTIAGLANNGITWWDYRDQYLFRKGTDVFQTNLYPLGKKETKIWYEYYKEWFGYGREDNDKYVKDVKESRFQILEDFWLKKSPDITICFGKTYWPEFKELLHLNGQPETCEDGHMQVYRRKRVVLTPFFGRGHMSDKRIKSLVSILKDMNIQPAI
jgi:hypothetical protein